MNHTISHRYVSIFSFGEERKAYYNAITLFFFFSPMKLTTRGFTLVELMIVIAIIGILAAALFPSMTNYLKRSRDAARAAGMKDIATGLGAFYADKETYPTATGGTAGNELCTGTGTKAILDTQYMPKGIPVDPTKTYIVNGCPSMASSYGYGTGSSSGSPYFAITALFENPSGGNTGSIAGYQGNAIPLPTTAKGAGSGYVLSN
jgi:prepilin-type N-terminal cleavage/methylation domain-containing protein